MTRTPRTARPTRSRGRGGVLLALVGALVAGILGMHALSSHGAPSAPTPSAAADADLRAHHAAVMAGTSHADHGHPTPSTGHGDGTEGERAPGHDLGTVMLCALMLAAAALTLLAALVGRRVRHVLPAAFGPAAAPAPAAPAVRGTGPPPVWRFSVVRC